MKHSTGVSEMVNAVYIPSEHFEHFTITGELLQAPVLDEDGWLVGARLTIPPQDAFNAVRLMRVTFNGGGGIEFQIGETGDDVDDVGPFGWIKSRERLVAIIRPMTDD